MYNLFLDDERKVSDVKWIELPLVNWFIAKDYNQFINMIKRLGLPKIISFDHDLADEHYNEVINCKGNFRYELMKEKTGYDCAKYLVEFCLNKNLPLPEYYIHTLNPIGRENIKSLLESYEKSRTI